MPSSSKMPPSASHRLAQLLARRAAGDQQRDDAADGRAAADVLDRVVDQVRIGDRHQVAGGRANLRRAEADVFDRPVIAARDDADRRGGTSDPRGWSPSRTGVFSESWAASDTARPAMPRPASQAPMSWSNTDSATNSVPMTTRNTRSERDTSSTTWRCRAASAPRPSRRTSHVDHVDQIVGVPEDGDGIQQQQGLRDEGSERPSGPSAGRPTRPSGPR